MQNLTPLKILFINYKDIEGGAAIAAYRLSKALEKYHGTDNYYIVAKKSSADPRIMAAIDSPSETKKEIKTFMEFMVNRITGRLGLQYRYFPFSTRFILKKAKEIKPHIISLHNTHGGYFKTSLIEKLSKIAPVVWTLHDMWAFTANAAHTLGDESWKQMKSGKDEKYIYPHIGIDTGKWLLKQKKKTYRRSNLHIVTPSTWMTDMAKQSPVFENKTVTLIPHGLDLDLFNNKERNNCKKALGIPGEAKVILFSSADDLDKSRWKGGPLLTDILKHIDDKTQEPIVALVVGKGRISSAPDFKHIKIQYTGLVTGERFTPILMRAADVFIYPTRADSFGLVLLEAIACGTPCVSFKIGGCVDIIQDDLNGYLIEPFDVQTFAEKTLMLLSDHETREKFSKSARDFAESHFNIKDTAHKYYDLFKKIMMNQGYAHKNQFKVIDERITNPKGV